MSNNILDTFSNDPFELQQITIFLFFKLISKNFFIKLKSISLRIEEILLIFFMLNGVVFSFLNNDKVVVSNSLILFLKE